MTDFIFRLDGFHLTKDQTNQISAAIQSAVTSELARLDLHASTSASAERRQARARRRPRD